MSSSIVRGLPPHSIRSDTPAGHPLGLAHAPTSAAGWSPSPDEEGSRDSCTARRC
jgi:hypothetical protein